jgi:heterotetrameric sarcosine oxidase gamma subunit
MRKTRVSAAESAAPAVAGAGVRIAACPTDCIELAAFFGRSAELEGIAAGRGLRLPTCGHVARGGGQLLLSVRPQRWLLLGAPATAGASAALWQAACAGVAAAIDLSSALTALHLAGPAVRELLARSCRLDLDPDAFPSGSAAATIMIQVSVILAALPSGLLLLTPPTTARHVREWLLNAARPFGLLPPSEMTLDDLSSDQWQ